jgi:hypothetical protein
MKNLGDKKSSRIWLPSDGDGRKNVLEKADNKARTCKRCLNLDEVIRHILVLAGKKNFHSMV